MIHSPKQQAFLLDRMKKTVEEGCSETAITFSEPMSEEEVYRKLQAMRKHLINKNWPSKGK